MNAARALKRYPCWASCDRALECAVAGDRPPSATHRRRCCRHRVLYLCGGRSNWSSSGFLHRDRRDAVPAVCGLLHRNGARRRHWAGRRGHTGGQCRGPAGGCACWRRCRRWRCIRAAAVIGIGVDHASKITAGRRRRVVFRSCLSTYYGASMVEQKLIWSAMAAGHAAPPDPV